MLVGKKVKLRAIEREDQRTFWRYNNDLELELLSSNEPPEPISKAAMEARFERRLAEPGPNHWFAIEADGRLIGACGLMHLQSTAGTCELGIRIGERDYWGRGYGRDAVSTLVDYGFRHLNMHRIWLTVLDLNERAIRAYAASGFQEEARLRRHIWADRVLRDEVVMGLLRSDWSGSVSRAD
jgi:RimJ/RimL family protein N-acetyltransferase